MVFRKRSQRIARDEQGVRGSERGVSAATSAACSAARGSRAARASGTTSTASECPGTPQQNISYGDCMKYNSLVLWG